MSATSHIDNQQQRPWERQPGESSQAFADFRHYLVQGSARTFAATARARRKAYSLIRRHAGRFDWRERARAFDVSQNRNEDEERRAARRAFVERQEEEAWKLWRLGLALVHRFVQRDEATGEWVVDPKLAPRDALALLKFVSDLLAQIRQAPGGDDGADGTLELSWSTPQDGNPEQSQSPITHPGLQRLLGLTATDEGDRSQTEEETQP
jgi:hypothetical protein